ncbi:thioredoxin family protein [Microbacterium tumbae]
MPVSVAIAVAIAVLLLATVIGLALRAGNGRERSGGDIRVRAADLSAPLAEGATLVQFSTEFCARCPQVRRMLGGIAEEADGVAHVEVDLTHRNDLAAHYHVLQTPTTFLVDATGLVLSRWGGVPERAAVIEALHAVPTLQEQS